MSAAHKRFYEIFDVFTDTPLSGNSLAIVHDSEGLDDEKMLAITREFNLSETVFILPPTNPVYSAKLRIFSRNREMPFSGYPTVGSVVSLALRRAMQGDGLVILEENVGPVRCAVSLDNSAAFAEFDVPQLPQQHELLIEKEMFAASFGLSSQQIGFENHIPTLWSAGLAFYFVPVRDLVTIVRAKPDPIYIAENFTGPDGRIAGFYLYCRQTQFFQNAFHARMFFDDGLEDAATGAAASAFCGVVQHFDRPLDGNKKIWIEQGIEMGRPSQMRLEWDIAGGELIAARIGGNAVKIAEGHLFV